MIKKPKKLMVLGAGGLLGSEFINDNYLPEWEIIVHSGRTKNNNIYADLTSYHNTASILDKIAPDAILNLVALTNVDYCEKYPNQAYKINVKTTENIVSWIKLNAKRTKLVHISTDHIYDGIGPHSERDVTIKNHYALSKYASELIVSHVNSLILRTNFFGKSINPNRQSITDWLFTSLKNKKEIYVFDDVKFSPLSMKTLCEMIALSLKIDLEGTFNLGANSGLSKAEFSFLFAENLNVSTKNLKICSINDVDFINTYRPRDMRLNVRDFEKAAGITLPSLREEIKKVSKEYLYNV